MIRKEKKREEKKNTVEIEFWGAGAREIELLTN